MSIDLHKKRLPAFNTGSLTLKLQRQDLNLRPQADSNDLLCRKPLSGFREIGEGDGRSSSPSRFSRIQDNTGRI